jgi:hypothetical protein
MINLSKKKVKRRKKNNLALDFTKKKFQNKLMHSKLTEIGINKLSLLHTKEQNNRAYSQRTRYISVNPNPVREINPKIRKRRRPKNKNLKTLECLNDMPRNARSLDLHSKGKHFKWEF